LGRAHQSHPAKHVLGSTVGGGWPLSQAQPWVANKSSAQPGSPCAGRQTPEGGRPWPGLTRPGPVRLAKSAAATLTNTPLMIKGLSCVHPQKGLWAKHASMSTLLPPVTAVV
jgi:hypothetical protein